MPRGGITRNNAAFQIRKQTVTWAASLIVTFAPSSVAEHQLLKQRTGILGVNILKTKTPKKQNNLGGEVHLGFILF